MASTKAPNTMRCIHIDKSGRRCRNQATGTSFCTRNHRIGIFLYVGDSLWSFLSTAKWETERELQALVDRWNATERAA